jgi:hypothetical protein
LSERSVAPHGRKSTPDEEAVERERELLEKIEEEIARLRQQRPALEMVIDRATGIITTHLACRRQRVIGVRVGLGGRYKFVFRSLRELGASYVIAPGVWSCTCPAHHRTGGPCKHALAAYVLWRAAGGIA